ncbi:MAG: class I SAM-dependent methyltransferase [Polyangiales bacterium]
MTPRRTRAGGARKRPARYDPEEPHPPLREALRAHKRGDLAAATERYREALRARPGSLDALANLGAALALRGRVREASEALDHALRAGWSAPRVARDVGMSLASLGLYPRARAAFARALELDASLVGALLAWSRACGEDGDPDEALAHAERAAALAPDDPSAWVELHRATLRDEDPERALQAAARAVGLDPQAALPRVLVAGAELRDGGSLRTPLDGLPEGLRAAVAWAAAHPAPCFGYKREALAHALDQAPREGEVIEMGVRLGVSARVLAARTTRAVHGFDSFEGLPTAWRGLPAGAFSMEGIAPPLPANVTLHVGRFEEALPPFASRLAGPPALVHVDSDLYESARVSLDALGPRLAPGSVLLFDEYLGNEHWRDDEHRAFTECAARFGWRWEALSRSLVTGQVALRLRA